jgi:hypothetical protein
MGGFCNPDRFDLSERTGQTRGARFASDDDGRNSVCSDRQLRRTRLALDGDFPVVIRRS